jgi:uncharacterized membrane protein
MMLWIGIRDSLWFIPGVAAFLAVVLATGLVQVPPPTPTGALTELWLFGGGVEGARGVLSTIAGSLITVTGVVFSVTIVALQLASSQFTPRVLRSFVANRPNQIVLGIFIGTFTYTLLVLRTIRSPADDGESFVPQVAVSVAVGFLLISIAALIFFIDHAARSVQASVILDREARHTLDRIPDVFPEKRADEEPGPIAEPDLPGGRPALVPALTSGYVQAISDDALIHVAAERDLVLRLEASIGAFVLAGHALATVWPAERLDQETCEAVQRLIVLGFERTPEQDIEFGIQAISDIAVRALSPGINDPTTATLAIDRLTEILAARGRRGEPETGRKDRDGRLRLIRSASSFERAAGIAYDQIRHFGAENPLIAKKLLGACIDLASLVPSSARSVLAQHVEAVLLASRDRIKNSLDLQAVERLGEQARAVTAS